MVPLFRAIAVSRSGVGDDVEIFVSSLDYRSGRVPLNSAVEADDVSIKMIGGLTRLRRGPLSRFEASFRYLCSASWHVLSGPKGRINIVLSQPPGLQPLLVALSRLRRQLCVVHIMDVYPDVAIAAGKVRRNGVLARAWRSLSRWSVRHADAVVVIGTCMRDEVVRGIGAPAERTHVVRNWAHGGPVPPDREIQAARVALVPNHRSPMIIGYSGNIGMAHDLDPLLDAAERLQHDSAIHFLIRGDGPRKQDVANGIRSRGLNNVTLESFVSEDALALSLRIPHIHIVSLRPRFTGLVVPSKAYGALAAARPVIFVGDARSDIAQDLLSRRAGFVVSDSAGVVVAIEKLRDPATWKVYSGAAERLGRLRSESEAMTAYDLVLAGSVAQARPSRGP